MTTTDQELEGITLNVYLYVAKKGKPVGPRDVMKGANLSSPSVAYRHLQKLEMLGLLQKNEYGEYFLKEKANIQGHMWVGRNLIPRLLVYSLFFLGLLIAEAAILMIRFFSEGQLPEMNFVYLTLVTAIAVVVLAVEGLLLFVRNKPT